MLGIVRKLLIYVHVPFCPTKCHFCSWVKDIPVRQLRLTEVAPERAAYVRAVQEQIRQVAPRLNALGYRPHLLYFGGGTPSMLSVAEFEALMATLRAEFDLSHVAEASIESSPDTLSAEKLTAYRAAGMTRLSIGVQSFDDTRLARHGRSHRAQDARDMVHLARECGFDNVNIDLMCGLPEETLDEVEHSVRAALELPLTHISLYPYGPAEGTVMHRQLSRGQLHVDKEERKAAYALGRKLLEEAGFPEYSMSYFSQQPCLVDLAYYQLTTDWIGFGPAANSLLEHEALVTHRGLAKYVEAPAEFPERTPASAPAVASVLLFQGLATPDGINAERWQERVGVPLSETLAQQPIAQMVRILTQSSGLITDDDGVRLPRERIAENCIDTSLLRTPAEGMR
jgi:putative oxygen-independent coproporphyrinogen III oxidase